MRKKRGFVYRIDLIERRNYFKRWKRKFFILRLIKYFYVFLKYRQFKKLARYSKRRAGLFETNYILALECRLVNFLYRMGIVESLFESFYVIKSGFVTKNWKIVSYPNEIVDIFDIVSFLPIYLYHRFMIFFSRLFDYIILFPKMRCAFFSIFFFFFYLFTSPKKKDIQNKKLINIYTLTTYSNVF